MKTVTTATASKSTTKAATTAKEETKEIQTVAVPSQVKEVISATATAGSQAQVAITNSEQTIIKAGDVIGATMGKNEYEVTRESVKPLFESAYQAANAKLPAAMQKSETALRLYVGQQLSRIMAIAYPGGKKATKQERAAATKQYEAGKKAGLGTLSLISLAGGKAKLVQPTEPNQRPSVVPIKKDNRGGHNAIPPIEALGKSVSDALTLAKTAGIDRDQILVIISEALLALEMMEEEESLEFIETANA